LYGHAKGAFTGASTSHRGLVAEADGGTLFLDEVGELPSSLQKSFLRVLQEHRYRPVGAARELGIDFRLVAATNRDLAAMTSAGTFRSDLLFRLHTVEVVLPPLRVRGGDILELAAHFVDKTCARYGQGSKRMSTQLRTLLSEYSWPGNVRELQHALERTVLYALDIPVLYPEHLPTEIRVGIAKAAFVRRDDQIPQASGAPDNSFPTLKALELQTRDHYLAELIRRAKGDYQEACRLSGISKSKLYQLLKAHRKTLKS